MNTKQFQLIKENRAMLHLCRTVIEMNEIVCRTCHEPYEISREALDDFSPKDFLAFQFDNCFVPHIIKCPACNVDVATINESKCKLPVLPQDDEDQMDVIHELI